MTTYKVSEQFSRTPGSRYRRHGKHSGEDLRDTLVPLVKSVIESGDKILIDLDGGSGYASSFLEEVFGGLARLFGMTPILERVEFKSEDEPYLIDDIRGYVLQTGIA